MSIKEYILNKFTKKHYNKYKEFYALKNINMKFNKGERIE